MTVTLLRTVRLASPLDWNASIPMLVTPPGIVALVRMEQYSNAKFPMLTTPPGNAVLVSIWQWENAPVPILVTLPGIRTLVRAVPANAYCPMLVTVMLLMLVGIITAQGGPE